MTRILGPSCTLSVGLSALNIKRTALVGLCVAAVIGAECSEDPPSAVNQFLVSILSISGNEQTGVIGRSLDDPVVVRLVDGRGLPLVNRSVSFLPSGSGRTEPASPRTDSEGYAEAVWTLDTLLGPQNLRVSLGVASLEIGATAALPAACTVIRGTDPFESNDEKECATPASTADVEQIHSLSPIGDVDWIRINSLPRPSYNVTVNFMKDRDDSGILITHVVPFSPSDSYFCYDEGRAGGPSGGDYGVGHGGGISFIKIEAVRDCGSRIGQSTSSPYNYDKGMVEITEYVLFLGRDLDFP